MRTRYAACLVFSITIALSSIHGAPAQNRADREVAAPRLQGATNGTIGPKSADATIITGIVQPQLQKSLSERIEEVLTVTPKKSQPVADGKKQESWRDEPSDCGLVKWHRTIQEASTASRKSGRPLFVFEMMGRLDKKFC